MNFFSTDGQAANAKPRVKTAGRARKDKIKTLSSLSQKFPHLQQIRTNWKSTPIPKIFVRSEHYVILASS